MNMMINHHFEWDKDSTESLSNGKKEVYYYKVKTIFHWH